MNEANAEMPTADAVEIAETEDEENAVNRGRLGRRPIRQRRSSNSWDEIQARIAEQIRRKQEASGVFYSNEADGDGEEAEDIEGVEVADGIKDISTPTLKQNADNTVESLEANEDTEDKNTSPKQNFAGKPDEKRQNAEDGSQEVNVRGRDEKRGVNRPKAPVSSESRQRDRKASESDWKKYVQEKFPGIYDPPDTRSIELVECKEETVLEPENTEADEQKETLVEREETETAVADELAEDIAVAEEITGFTAPSEETEGDEVHEVPACAEAIESADKEEEPILATEIEELALATELDSNIILPEEVDGGEDDCAIEDSTAPDWVPGESFLRECAQLELPALSEISRPDDESEDDETPEERSSGYSYFKISEAKRRGKLRENRPKTVFEFRDERAKKATGARNSIVYALILAVITLIFENLGKLTGASSSNAFSGAYSLWMMIFDIALILIGGFLIRVTVKPSASDLLKLRFNPESIGIYSVLVALAYSISCIVLTSGGCEGVTPLAFPSALCVLIASVFRAISVRRNEGIFEAVADEGEYLTLSRLEKNSAVPEYREFEGMTASDAPIYCMNRVRQIGGGYKLSDNCGYMGRFGAVLWLVCFVCAAALGVISYMLWGDALRSAFASAATMYVGAPIFYAVALLAERGRLLKKTGAIGSTVLREDAAEELDSGALILLPDSELFSAEDIKIVSFDMVEGGNDGDAEFERALGHIFSTFKKVGGSLSGIFSMMNEGVSITDDVRFTDISEHGVSAMVEGAYVRVGSSAYLGKYGITVTRDTVEGLPNERTVYVSENGVLRMKLTLAFTANAELCKRIRRLRECDVGVSLKTCDPCIDTELLIFTTGLEPELLRVVKYNITDSRELEAGGHEGGIVSGNGTVGLLGALRDCILYCRTAKKLKLISCLFALLSVGGMAWMTLGGVLPTVINAPIIGVYHILAAFFAVILGFLL